MSFDRRIGLSAQLTTSFQIMTLMTFLQDHSVILLQLLALKFNIERGGGAGGGRRERDGERGGERRGGRESFRRHKLFLEKENVCFAYI